MELSDWIDERHEAQVAFLRELVRAPSDNPPGDCAPAAERAAALLEGLGLAVERHPVPRADCEAAGMISATNLIVRKRFGPKEEGGPTIALNAHGDVVAPGEGWTVDPYGGEIKDGTMYGRGVAVSKSDFATYTFALLALEQLGAQSGRPLAGTLELHLTYDEETGGTIGPKWLLDRGLSKPDLALCAGFSYAVVSAHNGCLHLEVEVRGRSAHAARPETGADALEAATVALAALYTARQGLAEVHSKVPGIDTPSLVIGLIEGGINTNVVPDRVTFRLDRRLIPEESLDAAEADLRRRIEAAVAPFEDVSVEIRRVLAAAPLTPLAGAEPLIAALQRHASVVFETEVGATGVPLYTDARHYAAAGIPTVLYGAGPRTLTEANAHRADERLSLADLNRATKVVALALADLLGGQR